MNTAVVGEKVSRMALVFRRRALSRRDTALELEMTSPGSPRHAADAGRRKSYRVNKDPARSATSLSLPSEAFLFIEFFCVKAAAPPPHPVSFHFHSPPLFFFPLPVNKKVGGQRFKFFLCVSILTSAHSIIFCSFFFVVVRLIFSAGPWSLSLSLGFYVKHYLHFLLTMPVWSAPS